MAAQDRAELLIGIVSYCSASDLTRTLPATAALAREVDAALVVYDNASTDDSLGVAQSVPGVIVTRGDRNRGFAHGVNRLFTIADGRDVLLLNPDVEVGAADGVSTLQADLAMPNVGVVAPRLVNRDGTLQHSVRRFPTLQAMAGRATAARLLPSARRAAQEYVRPPGDDGAHVVDWAIGAALMVRAEAYASVGGWDERFFLYLEDVDFCLRLTRAGWLVVHEPSVSFVHTHHRASATVGATVLTSGARRHHMRSTLQYFWKHRSMAPRASSS